MHYASATGSTGTQIQGTSTRRYRVRTSVGVTVSAILIALSACILVAPSNMAMFPFVVGATEMSPFLAVLTLVWCLAANRLLSAATALRRVTMSLLVGSSVVAIIPFTKFTQVADAASAQLGTEESAPRFSFLTAIRGLPSSSDVAETVVPYFAADGSRLTMRIYSRPNTARQPAVAVVYGGAWRGGDASQCADVSRALAARGFVVAAIDYRHAPNFRYPAQLEDVRASLQLLKDSAASFNIDVKRIAILGRSSGGHLAELAAYTPGGVPVKAVVSLYAPYDLVEGYTDLPTPDPIDVRFVLRDFLGGAPPEVLASYRAASPSSYVRPGLPPTLLIFGSKDHIIKPLFNRQAASALRMVHVPVVAVEIPWAEHGFDMAPGGLGSQLAFSVIVSFLERELKH